MVPEKMIDEQLKPIRCEDCLHDGNCSIQDIDPSEGQFYFGSAESKVNSEVQDRTHRRANEGL